ncbi:ATP-binding cassette sub- F member 1, partial [Perkinsus olseni]
IFVRPDFTHTMCTKLLLSQIKKQATDTATLVAEQEAKEKKRVENIRAGYVPPTGLEAYSMSIPEGGIKCDDNALTVDGLTISAPKQQLFVDASFRIVQGRRYGLLGPNGYGKTTLLRHIQHGAIPVSESWDVFLVEQEAHATDNKVIDEVLSADATTVKLLKEEDDIMLELDEAADDEAKAADTENIMKLQDRLEEVIKDLSAREADKQEAKVRKILAGLGFTPEDQEKPVRQFSGGWRMRVSLARALFMQPKLLMLDEPTNHLDLDAVLWLDHYLAEEYPFTVLVVSHDADFLDSVCTDIISVENKKLMQYRGGYTDFQRMHEQQFAKQTKEWDLLQRQLKNCKSKADREALLKKNANITKPVEYKVKFNLKGQGQDDRLGGLGLRDVSFSYSGRPPYILNHVEFGVDCTSRIAVVGANGSGKSTFLKLLTSELEPTEGEINANHGLRVELFSQHFEEKLDVALTPVEQILQVGRGLPGPAAVKTPEKARQILGRYGLPSESHVKHIGNLSGGQKARVAFALLGLRAPHLLILDEPTNHLDIETVEALIESLEEYDGGVVVVSHDARLIKSLDCEMWICSDGTVWRFNGNFDKYRNRVLAEVEARERRVEQ